MQEKPLNEQQALRAAVFGLVEMARDLARLSQYAVCRKAGLAETTYWRWVKRPWSWTRKPMLRVIWALADLKAIDDEKRAAFDLQVKALGRQPAKSNQQERNAA